jgi:hypothetical protein
MKKEELIQRLRAAWSEDTSSDPMNWTPKNPAWGQCAVTACVVQDQLGGEVVWATAHHADGRRFSHYFNLVEGQELDLTREQFPEGSRVPEGGERMNGFATTRDYVLSSPSTLARYQQLARAVSAS